MALIFSAFSTESELNFTNIKDSKEQNHFTSFYISVQFFLFTCSFVPAKLAPNNRSPPLYGVAPPPTTNHGSATETRLRVVLEVKPA